MRSVYSNFFLCIILTIACQRIALLVRELIRIQQGDMQIQNSHCRIRVRNYLYRITALLLLIRYIESAKICEKNYELIKMITLIGDFTPSYMISLHCRGCIFFVFVSNSFYELYFMAYVDLVISRYAGRLWVGRIHSFLITLSFRYL